MAFKWSYDWWRWSGVEWTDSKFWTQENWDQHPNFSRPPLWFHHSDWIGSLPIYCSCQFITAIWFKLLCSNIYLPCSSNADPLSVCKLTINLETVNISQQTSRRSHFSLNRESVSYRKVQISPWKYAQMNPQYIICIFNCLNCSSKMTNIQYLLKKIKIA